MSKIMFDEGILYGDRCFTLKVNGWTWTWYIAMFLKMEQNELEKIANSSYNAIIFEEKIIFTTKEDYDNMSEWIESIFLAQKMEG